MNDSEQLLADLRKRSTTIAPLKLRRTTINKPVTVESLCDWETDKVELLRLELTQWQTSNCSSHHSKRVISPPHHQESLSRGQKLSLKSNADPEDWDIICPDGSTQSFPAVCFQIPPHDPGAIDKVDLYVPQSAVNRSLQNESSRTFLINPHWGNLLNYTI